MVTFEELGRKAAQVGLRILTGETPQEVARSEIQGIPMFDWHQLRRWNISGKRLPPSSVVLFKEATYWEKHHWLILARKTHKKASKAASFFCKLLVFNNLNFTKRTPLR
jgi:hypothetical protein